jgi:sugar lactone lactonase YvrE
MKSRGLLVVSAVLVLAASGSSISWLGANQAYPPGTILTVAGTGKPGFSGDGGPALQAQFSNPLRLAIDDSRNLFIADADNGRVRRVGPEGMISSVAGGGKATGDGGLAIQAQLQEPDAVAVDATGDLFVMDTAGIGRVRKVDPIGVITTVARNLSDLVGIDPSGTVFIVDGNNRVKKANPDGSSSIVAGGGHPADGIGDGGLATDARLLYPNAIAFDGAGDQYISDAGRGLVRRVSPDGKITTVAGGGHPADGLGDNGPATDALLDIPSGMVLDRGGNLFIAESHGERIRKVSPTGTITTVAGTGKVGTTGDGGPATAAALNSPDSVALDRAGNLYFTEAGRFQLYTGEGIFPDPVGNNRVREVIGVAVPQ